MFNKDFYPTPEELIKQLLAPYRHHSSYNDTYYIEGNILEPSAGKGDIVNYLLHNNRSKAEVHAIEIEHDLRSILSNIDSNEFSLISDDFLNFHPDEFYDYIIMNPPFSNGDEHLLKAIEIGVDTNIACILNAETIRNPYTERRKYLLTQIEKYKLKDIEFVQNAFEDAERKTSVEVALIWLDVKRDTKQFEFDYIKENELPFEEEFDYTGNEIMTNDYITNMQIRAEKLKIAYQEKLRADAKYNYYVKEFLDNNETFYGKYDEKENSNLSTSQKWNKTIKWIKNIMWRNAIKHMDLEKYMNSHFRKNFDAYINQQVKLSFNKQNVFSFFKMIMFNRQNMIDEALLQAFDLLTGNEDNRFLCWKTNSAYKVNKKVIAPSTIRYNTAYMSASDIKKYGARFELWNAYNITFLSDLDMVMCNIVGKQISEIRTIYDALDIRFKSLGQVRTGDKFDSTCESTFFKIKFFKKGTIHLEFKDLDLWNEFNYRACVGKKWMPEAEVKKHRSKYKKEKDVVKEQYLLEL